MAQLSLTKWLVDRSIGTLAVLALVQNAMIFVGSGVLGRIASTRWASRRITAAVQTSRRDERVFGWIAVVLNTAITLVGVLLVKSGAIHMRDAFDTGVFIEVLAFALLLDGAMYAGHRVAHHRMLYPLVHRLHHRYVDPCPATLFALHPLEAIGFGAMWIAVLTGATALGIHPSIWTVIGFAMVNLTFGLLGHLGVDPFPDRLRRSTFFKWIPSPAFHVGHHLAPLSNFGFFTTIWDRVFDTIDPAYDISRRISLREPLVS